MKSYKEKLAAITTFIFDIDGVFTDGKVYLFPEHWIRSFSSKDVYAVHYASKLNFQQFAITGGESEVVKHHLLEMGLNEVLLRSSDKLKVYEELKQRMRFNDEQVLYVGNDIPDIPVLKRVGVSACPQDASSDVKTIVDYHSPYKGGEGCIRDIIEQTLRVQNKWMLPSAYHW